MAIDCLRIIILIIVIIIIIIIGIIIIIIIIFIVIIIIIIFIVLNIRPSYTLEKPNIMTSSTFPSATWRARSNKV